MKGRVPMKAQRERRANLAKRAAHLRTSATRLWSEGQPDAADAFVRVAERLEREGRSDRDA